MSQDIVFNQIQISKKDLKAFENISVDSSTLKNDYYDYSNVVVKKPWGYEYLIYQSSKVAIILSANISP